MRKTKVLLIAFLLFFASACNRGNEQQGDELMPDDLMAADLSAEDAPTAEQALTEAQPIEPLPEESLYVYGDVETDEMTINWGFYRGSLAQDYRVIVELNQHFGVNLESTPLPADAFSSDIDAYRGALLDRGMPDIYINPNFWVYTPDGGVSLDVFPNFEHSREIPRDMIYQYAPNYANLLGYEPDGWQIISGEDDNSCIGLISYSASNWLVNELPVFRLDWLEAVGYDLPGDMEQIGEGLYFSNTAYNEDDFTNIMQLFAQHAATGDLGRGLGLFGENIFDLFSVNAGGYNLFPLMGMFGINNSYVSENGEATMYYAGDNYRLFLRYLSNLVSSGAAWLYWHPEHVAETGMSDFYDLERRYILGNLIGWWSASIGEIYSMAESIASENPSTRLLVTPPMLGNTGHQGVPTLTSRRFSRSNIMLVSEGVSDEKLAKILQIYDAISFDPELMALVRLGIEGDHYEWVGEPYYSQVTRQNRRPFVSISANVGTGVSRSWVDSSNNSILMDYAASDAGVSMALPPYKEDPAGKYAWEMNELNEKYEAGLVRVVNEFYSGAVSGEIDVDEMWHRYLAELRANGLSDYIELINKYEFTSE